MIVILIACTLALAAIALISHFRARRIAADRDRLSAELDAAHLHGAALADQHRRAERFAGQTLVRSVKRRAALVRIARYCRAQNLVGGEVISAGFELGHQVNQRDEAIEAMTARIAELMLHVRFGANRIRVLEAEIRAVLASAAPHPTEHPTMSAAWQHAREVLAKDAVQS